jgi:hypothetical protein
MMVYDVFHSSFTQIYIYIIIIYYVLVRLGFELRASRLSHTSILRPIFMSIQVAVQACPLF